jgi:hypothetical protein
MQDGEGQRTLIMTQKDLELLGPNLGKVGTHMVQQRGIKLSGSNHEVQFAKSRLTKLLNRRDLLVSRKHIVSSEGDLVRTQGVNLNPLTVHKEPLAKVQMTWHRGTTVIRLPASKAEGTHHERTITHLRSLTLPSQSIYFDRALSDEEVAEIVSGKGQKPHQMEGYVGTIGETESVLTGWANIKRAMILARLHWPPNSVDWVTIKPEADLSLQETLLRRTKGRAGTHKAILQDVGQMIYGGRPDSKSKCGTKNGFQRSTGVDRKPDETLKPVEYIEGEKPTVVK